jgi:hypothetical protein
VRDVPQAVMVLADRLSQLGWVRDLFVAGSLATGDYVPEVSDLDLVAIVDGPVDSLRLESLAGLHRVLDGGILPGSTWGASMSMTAGCWIAPRCTPCGRMAGWFAGACRA